MLTTKLWAVINDIQIPFQDVRVLDLAVRFIEKIKPHGVIINGDGTDCYSISRFDKNPIGPESLDIEIRDAGKLMDRLANCTKEQWWLGGNHEDRLRRYVWQHPYLFKVAISMRERYSFYALFNLQHYGFRWKEYGQAVWLGKLLVTHGSIVRKHSGETARAHYQKYGVPVLVGHSHRLGAYYHTNLSGTAVAYENGCLCRLDPEYEQNPDWQHAISLVHVDTGSKLFHVDQLPILKRSLLIYGGQQFT